MLGSSMMYWPNLIDGAIGWNSFVGWRKSDVAMICRDTRRGCAARIIEPDICVDPVERQMIQQYERYSWCDR